MRLPSLNATRAFEAFARTGSVKAASDELAVSPTVVSRHLRNLQLDLDVALVEPHGRGLLLTSAGAAFHTQIRRAFDIMRQANDDIRPASRRSLTLWCIPGIANQRLLAGLPQLQSRLGNCEIILQPTLSRPDLVRGEADAEVICINGLETHPDVRTELIAHPPVHAVASPSFRSRFPEVREAEMKTVYTRDSVIAVNGGAIVTRLGPPIRRGEELPVTRTLANLGMPILRTISGVGLMEGGSFAFITPKVAAVGLSSRVDEEGARQLEEVLGTQGVELLRVHLTGYRLHIDGMFVMIDRDTAFVNPTLLPFWFLEKLNELKIRQIEVCPDDQNWVINCLAVRPGHVIVPEGISPRTMEKFAKAGITTRVVVYDKVALGGGGIHCSTSPLIRDSL
ncbi:MAG: amidinotransferase [Tardiphaga sp.]|nr:amidinotransferase [Tardiphaga sp.]